ncbi:unnamed protein product [Protopolystoma xenopodis]|uniref:Uncharacterized protein n=1 Tax=Protopolystoma xenopodis TaxID=117903 RepID=A0A3S5AXJ3_9PLAT|nr:unnamed protein product [Protopolystoma xenopodis]
MFSFNRLDVLSLTVADAISGLGGEYDLLAASHRGVRLDTLSGDLNVQPSASEENLSAGFCPPPISHGPVASSLNSRKQYSAWRPYSDLRSTFAFTICSQPMPLLFDTLDIEVPG